MTKILLYCWNNLNDTILKKSMEALGYEVIPFAKKFLNYDMDGDFSMELMMEIHKHHCAFCFSFNYIPIISSICNVVGIPYISWVFDSPNLTLFSKTVYQKCNYIFVFDKKTYKGLQDRGVERCFYMPLAVDVENFAETIHNSEHEKYDISFVGSLYTNQFNYFDQIVDWDNDVLEVCNRVIQEQKFEYRADKIRKSLSEEIVAKIVDTADLKLGGKYEEKPLDMAAMMLQKKVTVEERRELLEAISEQFPVVIYTDSATSHLPKVQNKGRADYLKEMPLIFANSRINLNITLRSIETGIPLRALDVMACGGFLLSNYQSELAEHFEGKELVLFYDKQDCLNKIEYYLSHEEERVAIAMAGKRKVQEMFNYNATLGKMLEIVTRDIEV